MPGQLAARRPRGRGGRRCRARRYYWRPRERRPAAGLLQPSACRGRSRDRRGARTRARPPAAHAGDDRLGELRPGRGAGVPGLGADQQVRRGVPRPALLRRLRVRGRRRAAGDRPRQGPVRRRARQRPAALRCAGQRRRLPRAAAARGHPDGPRAGPRRPPHARDEDQRLRPALQHRRLSRRPGDQPDRHGRGRTPRPRAPAEDDRRRLVGLSAPARLRRGSGRSPTGRRLPDGRHGPLRRAGRRRSAPVSGADGRCRHHHHPQDDRWRPRAA